MAPQGTQGSGFMDLCMSLTTRFNRPTVYVDFSNIDYGVTILSGLHLMTWVGGWEWTSLAVAFRQDLDPPPTPSLAARLGALLARQRRLERRKTPPRRSGSVILKKNQ